MRTSAIQGLSRIASDLIVKNFDTPMKVSSIVSDCSFRSISPLFLPLFFSEVIVARGFPGAFYGNEFSPESDTRSFGEFVPRS